MATRESEHTVARWSLTSLPRVEDLPVVEHGFDPDRVRAAFHAFRGHMLHLQAQLRLMRAAGGPSAVVPAPQAVRAGALELAAAAESRRAEEEAQRQRAARARAHELERYRRVGEALRAETLAAAEAEARELLEQARQEAAELTGSARAEVEHTLEWARAQASSIVSRAQAAAQQLHGRASGDAGS